MSHMMPAFTRTRLDGVSMPARTPAGPAVFGDVAAGDKSAVDDKVNAGNSTQRAGVPPKVNRSTAGETIPENASPQTPQRSPDHLLAEKSTPGNTNPRTPQRPPTTPTPADKSTRLHRKFLRKVKNPNANDNMASSPASTPPRTRTPSPSKCRQSPTKQNLEVGQNGFYFSCELPMSKVTPKKEGTPVGSRAGTPSKVRDGEGRDLVKGTPKKDEDSRADTPTPKKIGSRAGTPMMTPKKTGTVPRPPSPLKHVMEAEIQDVNNKVTSTPIKKLPLCMLSKFGGGVEVKSGSPTKNGVPNKSVATSEPATTPKKVDSTNMIVVNETAPRKSQEDQNDKENFAGAGNEEQGKATTHTQSATPTRPKRGPSFNIGDMMAGLRTSTPQPPVAENRSGAEGMPTPLRKAAAKLQCTTPVPQPKENSTATQTTPIPNDSIATPVPDKILVTPPLQAAAPSTTSWPARKKVTFQQSTKLPSSRLPRPVMARRAGTDPLVYTAMREEMAKLNESLGRTSISPVTKEAEVVANDFFYEGEKNDDELVMSNSPGDVVGVMRKPMKIMKPEKKKSEKYPTQPGPGYTPTRVRSSPAKFRTNIAGNALAQREGEIGIHEDKELGEALPNSNVPGGLAACLRKPKGSSPTKSSKVSTPTGKKMAPSGPTFMPARPSAAKTKPAATISQAGRTSMFNSPLRSRTNTSPSSTSTAQAKPPKAAIPQRQNKEDSGRPVFASALDIANRVAEWNSAGRLKDTKRARKAEGTPNRTQKGSRVKKEGTAKKEVDKEKKVTAKTVSFTPPGSPVKPSATETTTGAGKEHPAPLPTVRHASTFNPHRIAPKPLSKSFDLSTPTSTSTLPFKPNPARSRLRAPRTPVPRTPKGKMNKSVGDAVNDPNAYRTPSKEIEKSLDEAINRKLAEDRKHVLHF